MFLHRMATVILACIFLAVAPACAASKPAKTTCPETQPALSAQELDLLQNVAQQNNRFAFDLYQQLAEQSQQNLFFSPYSISSALAMTSAGARGQTADQMSEVMYFKKLGDKLHEGFGLMIERLNTGGQDAAYQLNVANALWGQHNFNFLDSFLDLVQKNYQAGLKRVDFRQTDAARQEINRWVAGKTRDKIEELLKAGDLSPLSRLVLTNAIYFKGNWASRFKEKQTRQEPFYLIDGKTIDAPFMHQEERFGYMENQDLKILEMAYTGEEVSMLILLPQKKDGLPEMGRSIDLKQLNEWIKRLRTVEVKVAMPKFKMTYRTYLASILTSMGMKNAFDPDKANFSGMTGRKDLHISSVVHEAYVDVNEEGTEAAAATGVTMRVTSVQPRRTPVFRADHPFLFMIRDRKTNSVLFWGRVMDPSE
jgi:serpin B